MKTYIYNWYRMYNTHLRQLGRHIIGPRYFGRGQYPKKFHLGFLFPADIRHVLKFRRDPLTDVDEIGCKKSNICKTEGHATRRRQKAIK